MKARLIDVDGVQINVAERKGEGTPLLLATGIGAHIEMWAPLVQRIDRPLVAFDAPGTGRSPAKRLRMSGMARLVTQLLDRLGYDRVDALGYSWGGALAQELAHRAPERVRRLVLCATAPGLGSFPPKPVAGLLLATPARYYHPALLRWTVPRIAGGRTRRDPSALPSRRARGSPTRPARSATRSSSTPPPAGRSLPWLHRLDAPDAGRRR